MILDCPASGNFGLYIKQSILNTRHDLRDYLPDNLEVPGDFFEQALNHNNCCIYLLSCEGNHNYKYMGTPVEMITGFKPEEFGKGGMDFWLSRIDPRDLTIVSEVIINKFRDLVNVHFKSEKPSPLILRYRFRHKNGNILWVKDSRYLINISENGQPEMALCKFETISETGDRSTRFDKLLKESRGPKLLEAALAVRNSQQKTTLSRNGTRYQPSFPDGITELTKREKEILELIGEGLSSKMIAEKCFISIHTVETHRRHLLEKLNVNNSGQLIRQASKLFWF